MSIEELLTVDNVADLSNAGLNFNCSALSKKFKAYPSAPIFKLLNSYQGKTFKEKAFVAINGLGLCKTCGNPTSFLGIEKGFSRFCSRSCIKLEATDIKAIVSKRKSTMKERYGAETTYQSEVLRNKSMFNTDKSLRLKKRIETNIERYGGPSPAASLIVRNKMASTHKSNSLKNLIDVALKDGYVLVEDWKKFEDASKWTHICGNLVTHNWISVQRSPICRKCFPQIKGTSKYELEISEWIQSENIEVVNNFRLYTSEKSYVEFDVLCVQSKIAIEFNGLYWHSELSGKDKTYHLNKLNIAKKHGYTLIQIFENEWVEKQEICKSILRNKLGISKDKIAARQLKLEKIAAPKAWFDSHHISGFATGSFAYGLFDKSNKLRAAAIFAKDRFSKDKSKLELVRFATDGSVVAGALSKLSKAALRFSECEVLKSFCDLRWGTGSGYAAAGFKQIRATSPSYWYFYNNSIQIFHRSKFTKSKLQSILGEYGNEWQLAQKHGLNRFWDCGHLIFEMDSK